MRHIPDRKDISALLRELSDGADIWEFSNDGNTFISFSIRNLMRRFAVNNKIGEDMIEPLLHLMSLEKVRADVYLFTVTDRALVKIAKTLDIWDEVSPRRVACLL